MNSSKIGKLLSDVGLFAIGTLGSKLLLFLLVPLYTNTLSKGEYGVADLVFTVGDLLLPFVSLAIYNGLLRFGLIEGKLEDSIRCATIIFVLGSVLTILLIPVVSLYRPISEWRWFLALKVIASFAQNNALICLKIKDNNRLFAISSILQAFLLVAFNIWFLVILHKGIIGYLLSSIGSSILTAVFAFLSGKVYLDLKASTYNSTLLKQMVLYSVPFIANDISWWLIHSSDKVMIEWLVGASFLGLYTAASKIPSLINAFTSIFIQAWGIASIKEFDSSNDTNFYSLVFKYYFICMFGVCILIVSLIKPFMSVYVGDEFELSWQYVPLLLLSATFAAVSSFMGSMFGAVKKSSSLMSTTIIAAIIDVVLNYLFIQRIGVWGALVGTVLAYFTVAFARMVLMKKYIEFNYHYKILIPLFVISTLHAILVGLDLYVIPVSLVCIFLYFIIIKNDVRPIIGMLKDRLSK